MEGALVVLVIVVTAVAIDTIGRVHERRQRREVANATPERIVVDLTDRDGGSEDDR